MTNFAFSPESFSLAQRIIARYPEGKQKSALIPLLHIAQAENNGWLSIPAMDYIATVLDIQTIEVYEVATFYTMFNLKPVGNCLIEVCQTGPCWLCGAEEIITFLENKLGIKAGETTPDGKFTLKRVQCLAACGNAPVIKIGTGYHENMSIIETGVLIEKLDNQKYNSHQNPYISKTE